MPERVLPAAVFARAEPTERETARREALLKLRQRRLCTLKRAGWLAVVGREARRGHAGAAKTATAELAGFLGLRA